MRAINAFCDLGVSDGSLQELAKAVTDRVDSVFAIRWSPDWVPRGRPHTWSDDQGRHALCNDCLVEGPASRSEDEVVAWFDDHFDREHS